MQQLYLSNFSHLITKDTIARIELQDDEFQAVALAQFEKVEEKVKIRRDIAKMYNELFLKFDNFEPQEVPKNYKRIFYVFS